MLRCVSITPLGRPGGAGRVEHHADVLALALGDLVHPPAGGAGVAAQLLAPQALHVLEGMQVGRIVGGEPARLVVDDLLELRQLVGHRDHLVDLLLVLDDGELHFGVLEHVGHLGRHRVLVDRHGDAAHALHGGERGIQPRPVVADDRHRVAALDAELAQADGEQAHLVAQPTPCPGLPDAVVLVAQGRQVAIALCIAQQQLGYRVERSALTSDCAAAGAPMVLTVSFLPFQPSHP